MKIGDLISALFWLVLSTAAFIASFRMGAGTIEEPGRGFMPLVASALLGLLSLILLVKTVIGKQKTGNAGASAAPFGKKALMVLIAVMAYAIIMPIIRYSVTQF